MRPKKIFLCRKGDDIVIRFGIWKTRYTQNIKNTYEDWVRLKHAPVLFDTEMGALEYKHDLELKTLDINTEYEVRRYIENENAAG